jgi:hypothetical protein
MAVNRFRLLALPIATASLALAALRHARCMREHGVDVPDPTFGPNGRGQLDIPPTPGGRQAIESAENACRRYLEAVRGPEPTPEQQRDFPEAALRQARCMREHGIDMPDPTFSDRGAQVRLPKGVGPENPRFQEAQDKCAKYDPKGARRSGADR